MMSNSWDHGSKMAFGATTGVGPLYAMNSSSSKKLLAIESSSAVPYRHLPSTATRNFSTMGLVGSVVRKIVNVLIPTEAQIQNLEKNRQSLSAPDILVDISISTPILETTRGIAKLRIPDDNETNSCDQTKSLSVGNSPFDWCPIASEMDKMDSDKQAAAATCGRNKPRTRAKLTMPGSKFSYSDGCCSEILFKAHQQRSFTSAHGYKNSKTASKNRKQKNRRNQLVNMMEDVRSMTDDSESDFEADSPCSSLKDSQEKVSNCIRTTTTRSTEVSDKSVPLVCPLQLIDQTLQNASIINEEGFVIFAEDVQLTTPSVSPARRRDICAAINSFFVPSSDAPRRQRQISECSDDSIVFCYDSDDDSAAAIVFQQDIDSDSDHESDSDDDTCDGESDATFSQQPDSGFEEKKVRFNPVPEVHVIRAWDFAYRQARKGDWEMAARDRERFRKRIEDTGRALSVVFEQKQRERIFRERFSS